MPASLSPSTTLVGADIVGAIPTFVDNTALNSFPPVGNQGALGTCASYSSTYYQLSHETCLARGCNNKTGRGPTVFSPKWTYNMINGGVDGGSSPYAPYTVLASNGASTWDQFPYSGNANDYLEWNTNPNDWFVALNYRVDPMSVVSQINTTDGLNNLKQLIANGHILPTATRIAGNSSGFSWNVVNTSVGQAATGATVSGVDHMLTIAGYDDSLWVDVNRNGTRDAGETGALLIVNSWGPSWANSGKIWVAYDALQQTSQVAGAASRLPIFPFFEAYLIQARTSYTPSLVAKVSYSGVSARNTLAVSFRSNATSYSGSCTKTRGILWL